jgi:hypothetical protein
MPSTFSSLKIELIGTGEQSGTWGTTTNTNLGTAIEEAIVGYATANFSTDADLTITLTDSNATQIARNLVLNLTSTGSLTATRNLIVPTIEKPYYIFNNTSGSQSIVVKTSAGTGVTVPTGKKMFVYVDGTNVVEAIDQMGALTLTGNLAVNGNTTLGNATGDTITLTGTVASNVLFTDNTYDIGASGATRPRSMFLGTNLTVGSLTSGRVTFAGASGLLSDSANLTWNGTTLGITGALTASADSSFTSTGALLISKGTTGQQPGSPATGMMRYNTTTNQFEGYSGSSPAWKSIGGSALSNDTSTTSNLYPVFAGATSGTAENLYTSNAKLLYKPSTGELSASVPRADNGIFVNKATIATSYTIASGDNGMSAGTITVADGVTVTVSDGSFWTVV